MKKNSITYVLIFLVLVVWGVVFYNIFNPSGKNKVEQIASSVQTHKNENKRARLVLNYQNPFRVGKVESKNDIEKHKVEIKEEPPTFKYKGLIKGEKNKVIIIENNGVSVLIHRSDSVLSYKIIQINKDSVVLRKAGISYSLIKN